MTVYVHKNGNVTDTLTLTNPGDQRAVQLSICRRRLLATNGPQRDSERIDGRGAYGIETPSAAVPRTGAASYEVDLIGYETMESGVRGNAGEGKMDVDFATGNVVTNAKIDSWVGTMPFYSVAKISGTGNTFTGTFQYGVPDNYKGSIRFYGANAEEFGASWTLFRSDGDMLQAGGVTVGKQN